MRLHLLGTFVLLPVLACGDSRGAASAPAYENGLLAAGSLAPDVTLHDLDGTAFQLSSLRGKTVLLSFWFRNCTACQAELPHLSELWKGLAPQRPDVEFLAVNFGDSEQVVRTWWKQAGFTLRPVMQRGDEVSAALGVQAYPTSYVIGPDGKVIWAGAGYEPAMIRGAIATTQKRESVGG